MKILVSSAATVKQGIKALTLAAKEKIKHFLKAVTETPRRLKRLFASVFRPVKTAWGKCIKLQDRILFDGKIALGFIIATLLIFIVEIILQDEIVSYQNIMGVYDILSALFGAFFIKNTEIALYENMPAIYGVLGALLGALFIFTAAEGLRDRNEKYKVKIWLNSSKLNTLILLFLASLVFLIFPFFYIFSLIALIGFILFSIYSVYQILSILLNTEILWEKRIDLFKIGIRDSVDFVIDCQEKNKNFLEKINSDEIKFQYAPSPPSFMNFEVLNSTKEGTVIDIDLYGLKSIADKIDKEGEKQNIYYSQLPVSIGDKNKEAAPITNQHKRGFFIHIGKLINENEETPILSFEENIEIDRNKLQKDLNKIISTEKTTVVHKMKNELEEFKRSTEKQIKEKNFDQFKRHFGFYFILAEELLNQLSMRQPYSYQEAKNDSGATFSESSIWHPLNWLADHVMRFFKKARDVKQDGDSDSREIYEKIKWFSYHLISLSQDKGDQLLFQNALFLWQRQFIVLSDSSPLNKADIKNHINFFIEHILFSVFTNEQKTDDHLVFLLEPIKEIFGRSLEKKLYFILPFPYLEKMIYLIAKKASVPERFVNEKYMRANIEEIKYSEINPSVFEKPSSFESRKLQFLSGLGAYLEKRSDSELADIKKMIRDSVPRMTDLESYLKIYPLMNKSERGISGRWDSVNTMETNEYIAYTTYGINYYNGNTIHYFLSLMSDIPKVFFDNLDLDNLDSKTISNLENLAGTRFYQEALRKIETSDKRENIKNLFDKIVNHQNKRRLKYLKTTELDDNKIQDLIKNFRESFSEKERTTVKRLFQCRQGEKLRRSSVGINVVLEKDYFIAKDDETKMRGLNMSQTDLKGMSVHYGDSFFKSENKFLLSGILKNCKETALSCDRFKEKLSDRKWEKTEILLISWSFHSKIIRQDPSFFKSLRIAVDRQFLPKDIKAVIVDRSKLPALEMFNPADLEKELFPFQYLKDLGISIGIGDFSHNPALMKRLTDKPPDWLIQQGDKKAQEEYLSARVNIKIFQGLHLSWETVKGPVGEAFKIID